MCKKLRQAHSLFLQLAGMQLLEGTVNFFRRKEKYCKASHYAIKVLPHIHIMVILWLLLHNTNCLYSKSDLIAYNCNFEFHETI